MHAITQADLPDLARYPVSLQHTIAALWGVEPEARAPAVQRSAPDTPPGKSADGAFKASGINP